jgi:Predicted metal-binding protein
MTHDIKSDLVESALELGADQAKIFSIDDIRFDPRTLLKCLFGCRGGYHYCPTTKDVSNAATFSEMIRRYKWGLLIRTHNLKAGQEITLALESRAFLAGYHFAFGATECANCTDCTRPRELPCVDRRKLRPPLYALGIDVYSTVRGLGWKIEVVQNKGDQAQNITAVFVE